MTFAHVNVKSEMQVDLAAASVIVHLYVIAMIATDVRHLHVTETTDVVHIATGTTSDFAVRRGIEIAVKAAIVLIHTVAVEARHRAIIEELDHIPLDLVLTPVHALALALMRVSVMQAQVAVLATRAHNHPSQPKDAVDHRHREELDRLDVVAQVLLRLDPGTRFHEAEADRRMVEAKVEAKVVLAVLHVDALASGASAAVEALCDVGIGAEVALEAEAGAVTPVETDAGMGTGT